MDILHELVRSLNKKESTLFRKYIEYKSNKKERKDLYLFNFLSERKEIEGNQIVKQLYGANSSKNSNAYHALRRHLKVLLENFILQQRQSGNNKLQIMRFLNLAQNLAFLKNFEAAWHYLNMAENIAIKAEEYELLNEVYQHKIDYAWTQSPKILRELIQKEQANRDSAQTIRSINLALSVIQNQLNVYHNKVKKPNIEKIIQDALNEFGVQKSLKQSASQYYKLAILVKVSLEERENYDELYKYMIRTIEEMENADLFNKYNYRYRVELLNVVCYASLKASDYRTAEKYIGIIENENKKHPDTEILSVKNILAKAVFLGVTGEINDKSKEASREITGEIHKSIEVLEYLGSKYKNLLKNDHYFFMNLNCNKVVLYLYIGQINLARKHLNELLNHSKRIIQHFGLEDLFYCHASECMLAVEAKDHDYATSRLNSIERKFKKFLQQKYNKRNNEFIKLLRNIINSTNPWTDECIRKKILEFISLKPIYKPSSEFISFNAWLYSKLERVPYSESEYNIAIKERIEKGSLDRLV